MLGGLPRRDLWLLPLIAFATLAILLAGSEVAARAIWPEQVENPCMIENPILGIHYKPHCTATMKTPEGPWYTERFNDCGYRSDAPCGSLPAGTRRLALLGTSISEGYLVEYPDTIAARLEKDLSGLCDAPIQVQNLGSLGFFGRWMLPRMDEALRLKPQALLLLLEPFDIERISDDPPAPAKNTAPENPSLARRMMQTVKDSRAVTMAQHFMFRNPAIYLPLYLRYGDKADFMRPPFSPRWQARLQVLDRLIASLSARAEQAHVPFAIAFMPQEAQVGLMAQAQLRPKGVDPMALQKAIAAIAEHRGAQFIDASLALGAQPTPERLYYQADGHPSGPAQRIAAAYIAQHLPQKNGPFAQCKSPDMAKLERGS
jgi:hypothetical protein